MRQKDWLSIKNGDKGLHRDAGVWGIMVHSHHEGYMALGDTKWHHYPDERLHPRLLLRRHRVSKQTIERYGEYDIDI